MSYQSSKQEKEEMLAGNKEGDAQILQTIRMIMITKSGFWMLTDKMSVAIVVAMSWLMYTVLGEIE